MLKKPTKAEIKLGQAREMFARPPVTQAGQAEAAQILKDELGLTRAQISTALGLSERQVKSRLGRYKFYVSDGEIPTSELNWTYSTDDPIHTVLEDTQDSLERSALNRQSKAVLTSDLFEGKLAEAVAQVLPTSADLKQLEKLHKSFKSGRPKGKGEEEVAFATISDAHFGLVNPYFTVDTAREALETYMRKVVRLTDKHRSQCPVKKLVLNLNGDNVQGSGSNYPNQRWDTMLSVVDQCEVFTATAINLIDHALLEFDQVEVNCQFGNHGYTAPKSQNTEPDHANYETLVHRTLAWAFRNSSRVKFNVGTEWFQIVDVMGEKFLLTHGHAIQGGGSLDGIVSVVRKWADVLPEFDHVEVGHFHRYNCISLPRVFGDNKRRMLYMNGTTVIGDTFIQKFGAGHTNEYQFKFVGRDRGVTAEYAVGLYD